MTLLKSNHWYIIVNPVSGGDIRNRRRTYFLQAIQDSEITCEITNTQYKGHVQSLVTDAYQRGFRYFLILGGDGSGHELVNAILSCPHPQDCVFSLLPCGTGNDWVKQFGYSGNIQQVFQQWLNGQVVTQDLAKVSFSETGKSLFSFNITGLAFDGYVVYQLGQSGQRHGKLTYLKLVLQHLLRYVPQQARIIIDQKELPIRKYMIINAGICGWTGGGMRLTPHADPQDGLCALTTGEAFHPLKMMALLPKVFNGKLGTHPKVYCAQAKEIRVEHVEAPLHVEVDGEFAGMTPVVITSVPNSLNVWTAIN